ncbi:MAG: phosphate ABC transporter permease PstA [Steroidobacteraceae bacterium]|nr:phosphate ABC transporter permease PstA [Steroidobacteraceae bacterium]
MNSTNKPRKTPQETQAIVERSISKRNWAEKRFKSYGLVAVTAAMAFLFYLFFVIFSNGIGAFQQTQVRIPVFFDPAIIDPSGRRNVEEMRTADYQAVLRAALKAKFPEVEGRVASRELSRLVSGSAAFDLQNEVLANPTIIGKTEPRWLLASDAVDLLMKGHVERTLAEAERPVTDVQLVWIDKLVAEDSLELKFNWTFLTYGDSREPEKAGIWGAVVGSFYMLLITLLLSFPIGIATAIYLEEFARRNRWTDLIEVNINNLAAVPSIVFGLLGLAVFIGFFGLPRSAPLVGALVLTLLTLPTIIIASRAALKAVPPSIREAALGMGASKIQMVTHHVLPLAMPGMLTGTIIGMARALGESAPLLMIGMVAFIVDIPKGITDAATALPVQVFLWSDSPERGFVEKTSGAIIVLLAFLVVMNTAAVILRKRFERRW